MKTVSVIAVTDNDVEGVDEAVIVAAYEEAARAFYGNTFSRVRVVTRLQRYSNTQLPSDACSPADNREIGNIAWRLYCEAGAP